MSSHCPDLPFNALTRPQLPVFLALNNGVSVASVGTLQDDNDDNCENVTE